ncbi:MAG: norB, partial [Ramlibacter sp.]|nr:norB [Ramlibacter sp.]
MPPTASRTDAPDLQGSERHPLRALSVLWRWLGLIFVLSFGALGYLGWQIYLDAPPIPSAVVTTSGRT